jgi:hypothetical protein
MRLDMVSVPGAPAGFGDSSPISALLIFCGPTEKCLEEAVAVRRWHDPPGHHSFVKKATDFRPLALPDLTRRSKLRRTTPTGPDTVTLVMGGDVAPRRRPCRQRRRLTTAGTVRAFPGTGARLVCRASHRPQTLRHATECQDRNAVLAEAARPQ